MGPKSKEEKKTYDKLRRERIKSDPELLRLDKMQRQENYLKRKLEGRVQMISDMSVRSKRSKRKQWKGNSSAYRQRKKASEDSVDTPKIVNTPIAETVPSTPVASRQSSSGRKRLRRDRTAVVRENMKLREQVGRLERKVKRQQKRYERSMVPTASTSNTKSPGKIVSVLMDENDGKEIKKRLLFGEVVSMQLQENTKKIPHVIKMDPMHIFSSEEEEVLIGHVRGYPCLYNYKSKDYKDPVTKTNAWVTISEEMAKTEDVCKTKWKNIRDWYIRKKRDGKLPSGSGTVASLMRARFKRLSFLDGCDESRNSACNGSEGGEDDEDPHPFPDGHFISASLEEPEVVLREDIKHEIMSESDSDNPEHPSESKLLRKRPLLTSVESLWAENISNSTATINLLQELVRSLGAAKAPQQDDHLDKFFQGMAATVRNLPPYYQTQAKKQVANLVLHLESEALENAEIPNANSAKRKKQK